MVAAGKVRACGGHKVVVALHYGRDVHKGVVTEPVIGARKAHAPLHYRWYGVEFGQHVVNGRVMHLIGYLYYLEVGALGVTVGEHCYVMLACGKVNVMSKAYFLALHTGQQVETLYGSLALGPLFLGTQADVMLQTAQGYLLVKLIILKLIYILIYDIGSQ